MMTIHIQGLEWEWSQLYYMRQVVEKDDFVIQFRRASFGGRKREKLDKLILEVLGQRTEADTATLAEALRMNQKTLHRHLARLYYMERVSMERRHGQFFWALKDE